jgi:hypothetical protein
MTLSRWVEPLIVAPIVFLLFTIAARYWPRQSK